MKLFVDLETLQLIEGPGFRNPISSLRFKRGDAAGMEVRFLANGTTPAVIGDPASLELHFGIKPRNRYDVGYLVHSSDWTEPAPDAAVPTYLCSPSFNTTELNSALGVGSSTGSELSEITLMGEITWREGTGLPTSTRTFLVIVENDVNRGTEGVPENAEPAYPAPESIALAADLQAHVAAPNPHPQYLRSDAREALVTDLLGLLRATPAPDGIFIALAGDFPLAALAFVTVPGFVLQIPEAGVWEIEGRYIIYNDSFSNSDYIVIELDPEPWAVIKPVGTTGVMKFDIRHDGTVGMGSYTVAYSGSVRSSRVAGFIETSGPVRLIAYAYSINAGNKLGAGSWLRASKICQLVPPHGYYYGKGPVGGRLL